MSIHAHGMLRVFELRERVDTADPNEWYAHRKGSVASLAIVDELATDGIVGPCWVRPPRALTGQARVDAHATCNTVAPMGFLHHSPGGILGARPAAPDSTEREPPFGRAAWPEDAADDGSVLHRRRALPARVAAATWLAARGPRSEERFVLDAQAPDVSQRFELIANREARRWLRSDLAGLARALGERTERRRVSVVSAVTDTDECRKFHVDWTGLRVIVTYSGLGTEWVDDFGVNRGALGSQGDDWEAANRAIVADPTAVRRASAGDVVALWGEAWPGRRGRGAVHRSPSVSDSAGRRFLVKLSVEASS